jgi:hypothetical protein
MYGALQFKRDSLIDLPNKFTYKARSILKDSDSPKGTKSDSEQLAYVDFISEVLSNESSFSNFRRDYAYRQILEHVSFQLGKNYLEKFARLGIVPTNLTDYLESVDRIGNPRKYFYKGVGQVSPTTLRYLATAAEMCQIFDLKKMPPPVITEIGIGYCGQLLALKQMIEISCYNSYDLPNVQELASRYLWATRLMPDFEKTIVHKNIENVSELKSDLLISNYALSELPAQVQIEYVEKIAKNAKRGYLMMNSGKSNVTGRSTGKLEMADFLSAIPGAEIFPENPLSGPDNYLLLWGHENPPMF